MNENTKSPTKALFESLAKLYKQGHLLLMDSDRFMGEHGWVPMHNHAVDGVSKIMNAPQKWYPRWAMRFYMPAVIEETELEINRILFVSIHFASDIGSNLGTDVDEPLICAGRLLYKEPMTEREAHASYDYWMCKYWFISKPHDTLKGWRQGGQSRHVENLKGSESFMVPLYEVTSVNKLNELVIDPLLRVQGQDEEMV